MQQPDVWGGRRCPAPRPPVGEWRVRGARRPPLSALGARSLVCRALGAPLLSPARWSRRHECRGWLAGFLARFRGFGRVVAAAPRPSFMGFLSFRASARFVTFASGYTAPRWGARPAGGRFGAAPAPPPLMARGAPRPLLRFGWSLRSHRPAVRAASAQRCRASRGFFFGYRWGCFTGGWRSLRRVAAPLFRSASGLVGRFGSSAYGVPNRRALTARRLRGARSGAGCSLRAVASLSARRLSPSPAPLLR